jgi:ABC-2 type transport system ATP-binding protein
VAGLDVAAQAAAVRRQVGWVPQDRTADPLLTAAENVLFMAGMYHLGRREGKYQTTALLATAGLDAHAGRLARDLSGGMRRKLELAMSLINTPAVLFLDEPTLGLDISARRNLWSYIGQVRRSGTTIVMTTHYLEEADALCDRVAIIDRGRIRAVGTPVNLKRRYRAGTLDEVFLTATGRQLASQPTADQLDQQ